MGGKRAGTESGSFGTSPGIPDVRADRPKACFRVSGIGLTPWARFIYCIIGCPAKSQGMPLDTPRVAQAGSAYTVPGVRPTYVSALPFRLPLLRRRVDFRRAIKQGIKNPAWKAMAILFALELFDRIALGFFPGGRKPR